MAPSTPPPPSSEELAAFTMASTACSVMSPRTSSTGMVADLARVGARHRNGRRIQNAPGEQGPAGHSGRHDQDRAERNEETHEHRRTESERQRPMLAQDPPPVTQLQAPPGERDADQFNGEKPAADQRTDNWNRSLAD